MVLKSKKKSVDGVGKSCEKDQSMERSFEVGWTWDCKLQKNVLRGFKR